MSIVRFRNCTKFRLLIFLGRKEVNGVWKVNVLIADLVNNNDNMCD